MVHLPSGGREVNPAQSSNEIDDSLLERDPAVLEVRPCVLEKHVLHNKIVVSRGRVAPAALSVRPNAKNGQIRAAQVNEHLLHDNARPSGFSPEEDGVTP